MPDKIRVMLEIGLRGKKVVAVAPDWPGLERGAGTEDAALERLLSYVPRYAPVAKLGGMEHALEDATAAEVVERYPGTGSTDFWAISFAFSDFDRQEMSDKELERELALMRASWAFFDSVRSRVSADLQKGPRGGGRDRDQVVRHVTANDLEWGKKLGIARPESSALTDEERNDHRDSYCNAILSFHAEGKTARNWPLRFLIRHTAFHTLDHAWEMEDRDLSPAIA